MSGGCGATRLECDAGGCRVTNAVRGQMKKERGTVTAKQMDSIVLRESRGQVLEYRIQSSWGSR